MDRIGIIRGGTLLMIGLITACGASSRLGKDPATAEDTAAAPTEVREPTAPGEGIDVGVQFEDKGDVEKADRTPPPTQTWKPVNKNKQAANQ